MLKEHIDKQICNDVLLCLWSNEPQCKLRFDYLTEKYRTKDANGYSELQMTFQGEKKYITELYLIEHIYSHFEFSLPLILLRVTHLTAGNSTSYFWLF